jgi:pimeloyl-ACP methyl ester carboxylesterase
VSVRQLDVALGPGATLRAYDTGGVDRLAVVWHHGTPNVGAPPTPLFAPADRLGLRWVSYDRPGYGGSSAAPGRTVGDAATWMSTVLDALDIERCVAMGHSGGGSHALAAAALLGPRCAAVVSVAGLAPFAARDLDWFAGMAPSGQASLRAAAAGRAAKEAQAAAADGPDDAFTDTDVAALRGEWGWLGSVVGPAVAGGPGGLIDDDLAYVAPWGCDPADIAGPVLLLHGARDAVVPVAHGRWLAGRIAGAELRVTPDDGHLSVLGGAEAALAWIRANVP